MEIVFALNLLKHFTKKKKILKIFLCDFIQNYNIYGVEIEFNFLI